MTKFEVFGSIIIR